MIRQLSFRYCAVLLASLLTPGLAAACGTDTDCPVSGGIYRLAEAPDATGVLIYAHGYKGKATNAYGGPIMAFAQRHNLHLVALQASGDDWNIANVPSDGLTRDERAYLDAVLTDVEARLGFARSDMMLSGFSAGGMFVSEMACHHDFGLKGFIALSGTVWAPEPSACTGQRVPFVHIHGTEDRVVPLGGRPIGRTKQGDVPQFLDVLANGLPAAPMPEDTRACDRFEAVAGAAIYLCLIPAGHVINGETLDLARRILDRP